MAPLVARGKESKHTMTHWTIVLCYLLKHRTEKKNAPKIKQSKQDSTGVAGIRSVSGGASGGSGDLGVAAAALGCSTTSFAAAGWADSAPGGSAAAACPTAT